ncbi:G patch domain-containing protein 1 [Thelohanellus kitauei]|uniref:G patch domain-containing protein 1 n=1 Tax=Thelohanellus kitauei TaxID=669202 RepID=A0A0C2MKE7_THEKT|nr:G patch domain-containing protein 1 [Thelohanellus kitauei]
MSSSDYEHEDKSDENKKKFTDTNEYVVFGTPIELNEEELETGKKKMRISDQVATDERGRRRFHGAFTGGFSAGFFNSCGSKEGWTPSTFVSSRSERNQAGIQKPENYMDDEDFSEFGIAPKKYTAKSKFQSKTGSIRNEIDQAMESHNVLRSIISDDHLYDCINIVPKTTVGFDLLRRMGWKEGRGFGEATEFKKDTKVYGCDLPPHLRKPEKVVLLAPKAIDLKIPAPKTNLYGIGYKSLKRDVDNISDITKKREAAFKPTEREGKGIRGTAFGIGVFDEYDADEEIYHQDNIDDYDYSIDSGHTDDHEVQHVTNVRLWFGFVKPKSNTILEDKQFNLPVIPDGYSPAPILGPEVSDSYEKGSRRFFDSKARAKAIETDKTSKKVDSKPASTSQPSFLLPDSLKRKFHGSGEVLEEKETPEQLAIKSAQNNMFGKMTRTITHWLPSDVLCKRWNVVCLGSTSVRSERPKINAPAAKRIVTAALQPTIKGPLSVLNQNNIYEPPNNTKKTYMDKTPQGEKTLSVQKLIEADSEIPMTKQNEDFKQEFLAPKRSMDLFKAVFCDSDED